ncbi:PD-(D/E)XK nuclease family protein [Ottowia testudinis]|uniref:PD-(D/E)XK nuclease family protein n=1 Tax=Ottowia testudinis TaxID=2816950 RepID=UPI0032650C62
MNAWQSLLARIDAELRVLAAHPARSVVLLPYAQLMPLAARLWAARFPDAFAPRFETTRNWAARAGWFTPGPHDISFDHGRDLLTAAALLEAAGLAAQRALLAGPLVEQVTQLGQIAASLPPALRPDWAEQARAALPPVGDGPLALEAAVGRIAVAWAGNSDYATDVLFAPRVANALDALLIVPGLLPDPLAETLAEHYFEKAVLLNVQPDAAPGQIALHACADAEDEAERAAACVLRHIEAGRVPVALIAGDRLLTRRIGALLAERGVRAGEALRDETGWKLSTTHAAAQLMAALHACAPRASTDDVLDWLKLAPAFDAQQQRRLERHLRRHAVRGWPQAAAMTADQPLTQQIESLRAPMHAPRPLADWLPALRALLQGCGLWPLLAADVAGNAVTDALGLGDEALADWRDWPAAQRRMGLAEFTRWVGEALEAASFRPPHPAQAQVVVLPLAQLLGRPFAALVLPGADEQRLPAAPEPPGPWSAAQRQALRLPTRDDLRDAQAAAWALALRVPHADVLWRHADDNGEPLLPSPLVQSLQLQELAAPGTEAREARFIQMEPTARPQPRGDALPTQPLSASGYEMLRACPYRFFALRQLALAEEGELDVDIDKRDWGNWLHDTLRGFHEALRAAPGADRLALIDAAADAATQALGPSLEPGEFMPFAVAWPRLRDAYLAWLATHEASGATFALAEEAIDAERGALRLKGQIDRIDHLADGAPLLIDYKTEPLTRTRERIKAGNEDTQLPFYALLAGADAPRAAYLNLAEREAPSLLELPELPMLAAQLYEGMAHDVARIAAGEPLLALGEGSVCDWCDARGLCRKDFWNAE